MVKKGKKIPYDFDPLRRAVVKVLPFTKLSGADFRVLLLILSQTDGYIRAQDEIKPYFFSERTGMSKGNVRRTIARLVGWNMISKNRHIYEVLPPDQWDNEVFVETKKRFNLEALLAEKDTEKRFNSEAELPPSADKKRFNLEAPTASNLKRSARKIEAVLASPKEELSKEELSKEEVAPPTPTESKILNILKELKGWRYDQEEDIAWLREFMTDYPDFSLAQAKACRDYYSGRAPAKNKGIWKNRLRNWMVKEREFQKGGSSGRATSPLRRPQTHQGVTPPYHVTTDEERRRAIENPRFGRDPLEATRRQWKVKRSGPQQLCPRDNYTRPEDYRG